MHKKLLIGKMLGVLAVLLALFMAIGVAEEERTDASGQWKYVLEEVGAIFMGCVRNPEGELEIPSKLDGHPVTGIGAWAFEESVITYVLIPDGVTRIGEGAFAGCFMLDYVTIPDSVTEIGSWAFNGCSGMLSVFLPNKLTSIGEGAFYHCGLMYGGLRKLTIPAGVTFIGEEAFTGCDNLTLIVTESSYAEQYAKTNNIAYEAVPSKLTVPEVKENEASLAEEERTDASGQWKYVLEDGGATITGYVEELSGDLVIPSELDGYPVTRIDEDAFSGCSVTGIVIPDSVISIGDWVFSGCSELTGVTIPNSILSIGNAAFSGCSGLTDVTIPNSVTDIGSGVFYGCSGLTSVTIATSVMRISDSMFQECSRLTSVTIPDGVVSIEEWAFYGCSGLTNVTIPDSVTSIGEYAFANCSGLASLTIPSSVVSIGDKAFRYAGYDDEFVDNVMKRGSENVTLTVTSGSYAKQYAIENDIPYILTTE